MWTFQYWLDRSLSESSLDLDFSWQEQSIGEKFSFSRPELSEALGNSIKLWEPGANEAVGL